MERNHYFSFHKKSILVVAFMNSRFYYINLEQAKTCSFSPYVCTELLCRES
jgi:hypothetical protein